MVRLAIFAIRQGEADLFVFFCDNTFLNNMILQPLQQTVILIDTDFINEMIVENFKYYKKLHPDKEFRNNIAELIYRFVESARVHQPGQNIDILFAYHTDNDTVLHFEPGSLAYFNDAFHVQLKTDRGVFLFRSFFGYDDETCGEHLLKMLSSVNFNDNVSKIVVVSDDACLNTQLAEIYEEDADKVILIKRSRDSEIDTGFRYVNIDHPIAFAFGLERSEL